MQRRTRIKLCVASHMLQGAYPRKRFCRGNQKKTKKPKKKKKQTNKQKTKTKKNKEKQKHRLLDQIFSRTEEIKTCPCALAHQKSGVFFWKWAVMFGTSITLSILQRYAAAV